MSEVPYYSQSKYYKIYSEDENCEELSNEKVEVDWVLSDYIDG